MFDLKREVAAWSASVLAERCEPGPGVAELTDHLYCEIDRARETGLSEEEAFRAATARLGTTSVLAAEHAKNRSLLSPVCRVAAKFGSSAASPAQRRFLTTHALLWAALMIASALMLAVTPARDIYGLLLTVVFLPLWWASDQLLRKALRHRQVQ